MVDFNYKGTTNKWSFGQQHILQKGLKLFKNKGCDAAIEELDQLHRRMRFTPVDVNDLTRNEKKKAMEALMLMTEKKIRQLKVEWFTINRKNPKWHNKVTKATQC